MICHQESIGQVDHLASAKVARRRGKSSFAKQARGAAERNHHWTSQGLPALQYLHLATRQKVSQHCPRFRPFLDESFRNCSNVSSIGGQQSYLQFGPTLQTYDHKSPTSGSVRYKKGVAISAKVSDTSDHCALPETYQLHGPVKLSSNRFRKQMLSQYRNLLLVILALISLECLQNAPSCFGFSYTELDHSSDLVGDHHSPQQPPHLTYGSHWARLPRSYNDETMSSSSGSFSQDQSSTITPPSHAPSWTSILNPFGFGQTRPAQSGSGGDDFDNHIKKILVPRVSGTAGNIQVRQYVVDELKKNDYHVELDEFSASTPVGKVNFANIIASSNQNACRQLVLACHYDSKMMDNFLGAIDSAVPCAMLLKLSDTFNRSFRPTSQAQTANSDTLGLQFIFFDGEEAFVQWSQTDSLYGSRHLAAKLAKQPAPDHCGLGMRRTELDRIELFVLLDLIGASDSSFVMYNSQLKHHYEALQKYEKSFLTSAGLNQLQSRRESAFKSRSMPLDFMEDDHVPFRKRGVSILLLLAHPFPKVWHTPADNYEAIDFPRTRRILHVMEQFVANYPKGSSGNSSAA